ncbi:hypothetical protein AVANS_0723 [Campylobacter sp. RM5004]|uniref:hypothetical protein n=1 Tax=Campylobacter sp. RM5004 TaxID=1660078 RepID=UPI001EFB8726|nr:hypothetical protein [Campylobacter sp. RM5004]ULO01353.1 hypothetical protein AVANS_0723 [Campylobacter sp. RM5004]
MDKKNTMDYVLCTESLDVRQDIKAIMETYRKTQQKILDSNNNKNNNNNNSSNQK